MKRERLFFRRILTLFLSFILSGSLHAQLKGDHLLGDAGLQSGTQTPPGFTLVVPVYFYNAAKLKNGKGELVTDNLGLNMFVTGIGGAWVTNLKILGGNYGGTALFPFASNRLESTVTTVKSPFAFTDIYLQPVQLGWHLKRADFVAGYALYLPSGKYEQGGDDNSGLGQLVNEFSGGSTVYFDKRKSIHFSALLSYALNGKKKGTDVKTGDNLSIEGGLGKTWYLKKANSPIPTIINAGIIYYMQFKTTEDHIPLASGFLLNPDKDQIYGIGAEGNVFIPHIRSLIGVRWLGETGAKNRLQGNTYMLTIAYMLKTFEKKKGE
ncbi:transporter [Chitinophaga sp. MM2321]|uniref:SphA family protein n=1 Tax=Chitinophaga sp. MM2321 TaxID=3137178 RepID=UPI0032D59BB5